MKIQLFDTSINNSEYVVKDVRDLLDSGKYILGKNVREFEKKLSKFLSSKFVIGVNSGTDALTLSLVGLGIRPGDYVITSCFTYFATVEAVKHAGGIPYIVDVDKNSLQMNFDGIDEAILKKAKFIIPVHLFGGKVDLEKLIKTSKKFNLKIVEDVAQSFGTNFENGSFTGTIGDAGAFSFYPTKTLGSVGDEGAISTNNKSLYEDLLKLRNHGHIDRDNFAFPGYNSRLDEIQAIYLNRKLETINEDILKRKEIASMYFERLEHIKDLNFYNEHIDTFNYFPISTVNPKNRNGLIEHLNNHGVGTAVYYKKTLADLNFKWIYGASEFKNADYIKKRILCLPIYPKLEQKSVEYVVKKIKEFYHA